MHIKNLTQQEYNTLLNHTIFHVVKNNSGTKEDAEDFLHNLLVSFMIGEFKNYKEQGKFVGYIISIMPNKWIDYVRSPKFKEKRATKNFEHEQYENNSDESDDFQYFIDYDNFLKKADWNHSATSVMDALWYDEKLLNKFKAYFAWEHTECKERLDRAYGQGLSREALANLEGSDIETVTQRLRRCRKRFKEVYFKLCELKRKKK
jgi:RNA polymerase sigma factor (sigma-70 family)